MPFAGFRFPCLKRVDTPTGFTQKINYSLIDFNHHLNSYHYLRFAYDALDTAFKSSHYPCSFHAKFEREVHLDETIAINAETNNNETDIQINRIEEDKQISCFKMNVKWKK